jgi:hypothetical protein
MYDYTSLETLENMIYELSLDNINTIHDIYYKTNKKVDNHDLKKVCEQIDSNINKLNYIQENLHEIRMDLSLSDNDTNSIIDVILETRKYVKHIIDNLTDVIYKIKDNNIRNDINYDIEMLTAIEDNLYDIENMVDY